MSNNGQLLHSSAINYVFLKKLADEISQVEERLFEL